MAFGAENINIDESSGKCCNINIHIFQYLASDIDELSQKIKNKHHIVVVCVSFPYFAVFYCLSQSNYACALLLWDKQIPSGMRRLIGKSCFLCFYWIQLLSNYYYSIKNTVAIGAEGNMTLVYRWDRAAHYSSALSLKDCFSWFNYIIVFPVIAVFYDWMPRGLMSLSDLLHNVKIKLCRRLSCSWLNVIVREAAFTHFPQLSLFKWVLHGCSIISFFTISGGGLSITLSTAFSFLYSHGEINVF